MFLGNPKSLRIPDGKMGGTLGKIRGITTPGPLRPPIPQWRWLKISEAKIFLSSIGCLDAKKASNAGFMAGQPTPPNVPPPEIRPY